MRDFIERDLPRLTELIYEAALEPVRWQAFLDALIKPFGGANGVLYAIDRERGLTDFNFNFGIAPEFLATFLSYYSTINPYGLPSLALPLGRVMPATHAVGSEAVENSEFFSDWMRPQGIPADHLGVLLQYDGQQGVIMGLAPNSTVYCRGRGRYARQFDLLVPHLTRALEINRRLGAAGQSQVLADAGLEACGAAAVLIDRSGRLLRATPSAEALLRQVDGALRIERYGALKARQPAADTLLSGAITLACVTGRASGPIRVPANAPQHALLAWIIPAPAADRASRDGQFSAFAELAGAPAALIVLTALERTPAVPPEAIAAAFMLPPAEARLVSAIVAGETLDAFAARNGLSRNTVRNQLSRAFERTGTSRQAELVARVVSTLRVQNDGRRPR